MVLDTFGPQMKQAGQSKSPVKYELLTPLGDITDRREIAEIVTFRTRIVTDRGIDSDPESYIHFLKFDFNRFSLYTLFLLRFFLYKAQI